MTIGGNNFLLFFSKSIDRI